MMDFEADGQDEGDEVDGEIEITFEPHQERFRELGISFDDFQDALMAALEAREAEAEGLDEEDELPPLEEMVLTIKGGSYKLEELADVEIKERGLDDL